MMIKDKLLSWYINNVLLNKRELIDNIGFLVTSFTKNEIKISLREFFLSETFFSELEKKTNQNIAYKIGKCFGYIYAKNSNFPVIEKEREGFINTLIKYMESVYSSRMEYKIENKNRTFFLRMKDYIICRKNGLGYFFSTGGIAGIWSYACQDLTIEAVQPECQGRGDRECLVIAAPRKELVKMGYKPTICKINEKDVPEIDKSYQEMNRIRPARYARNSLKSLIDSGFFKYRHGQITYKGERFFLCEASFMYILEKELKKTKNGLKTLWQVGFDFGKRLAKLSGPQDPCKFITDFFPALGFGDVLAVTKRGKYEIYVNYVPWMKWWKDIDFTMFRAMLSGTITGFAGKRVKLNTIEKDISAGYLSLFLTH